MILTKQYDSPLGGITLVFDGEALAGLCFEGQKHAPARSDAPSESAACSDVCRWLTAYFAGEQPKHLPKLSLSGTPFQLRVWDALLRIPYGETVTYAALAKALHTSPRAIGTAVGRNPVSLIVPCHRVVGKDGALTGYAGGLERKAWLLQHEREHRAAAQPS